MIDEYFQAFQKKDLNALSRMFHPQVRIQDPFVGIVEGRQQVLHVYQDMFRGNDFQLNIKRSYQNGINSVAVEFSVRVMPHVEEENWIDGIDLIEIKDKLIYSIRAYLDTSAGKLRKGVTMENYGGNQIRRFDGRMKGRQDFATAPYVYYYYRSSDDEVLMINNLQSFSVYVFNKEPLASIEIENAKGYLYDGDMVQVEGQPLTLRVANGAVELLVAGVEQFPFLNAQWSITRRKDIKKVNKPWGYELWINGEHPSYAFKHIYIKSGCRTSLQYHHFKRETNVLVAGEAKGYYKRNASVANDEVTEKDIDSFLLSPVSVLDIEPGNIHRIESLTDIILCEVSTPYLDDVIRVSDDTNRKDGRIHEEHRKA